MTDTSVCPDIALPGILSVAWLPLQDIPHYSDRLAAAGITVSIPSLPQKIDTCGFPVVSVRSIRKDNCTCQSVSLKFDTARQIDIPTDAAFIIRDIHGSAFLIGSREALPPVVQFSESSGDSMTARAVCQYEVSFINNIVCVKCFI